MLEYRTGDDLTIHRAATVASVEHLSNGVLVVNGEALGTASTRSSIRDVPVDPEPNAWADVERGTFFVKLDDPHGRARRITYHGTPVGRRALDRDIDDLGICTFVASTTAKANEALVLCADGVVDQAKIVSYVGGSRSVELYVDG